MKQCPVCNQMMWLENDGFWNCSTCSVRIALMRGDEIFRRCGVCNNKLQFQGIGEGGHIFACPDEKSHCTLVFKRYYLPVLHTPLASV